MPVYNEADTCRRFITPKLIEAGWDKHPSRINQEYTFTDGRIQVYAGTGKRRASTQKRADYLLRYRKSFPIAVVEAKEYAAHAATGLQQAKEYAEILGLKFAYATNGREIIEFDYFTGQIRTLTAFPTPDELWERYSAGQQISAQAAEHLLEPSNPHQGKTPRYYQEIAINRVVESVAKGQRRLLLTMATGTGKTYIAFQICWKLWNSGWNRTGDHRKPRILFLADRNILVDDPKDKTFTPFGDARYKIEGGQVSKGREMYFALYQALADRDGRPGLYQQFPPDFFDLIIVDECHRGSARDDSDWRTILEYFAPAFQLGMTATPLREDNRDTYQYFGDPVYEYSLKQGIIDGFLAPYTVHRVITDLDAKNWRPPSGYVDRYQREVPEQDYTTDDYERVIVLKERTHAIAQHLSDFIRERGGFAKTIVFCVDQEHAADMLLELTNLNPDMVQRYPDFVCRVTSDEGDIGRGHLSNFQDVEKESPVVLTTSKLLTTGVDIPTCQVVVIARVIKSMTEFKQIIGRGTRVRDEYGKLFFNIIDYTGSATKLFADPEFDGFPAAVQEVEIDEKGKAVRGQVIADRDPSDEDLDEDDFQPRKYYVDDVSATISAEYTQEIDENGKPIVVRYVDYTAEKVRTLYPSSAEMRKLWIDPAGRSQLIQQLSEAGIDFERLAAVMNQDDADPFDLLCHVAFNAPIRTRTERANRVRLEETTFFNQYTGKARDILFALLDKYADLGALQFVMPDVLKVPPLTEYGSLNDIIRMFGGTEKLKAAVGMLQGLLYAA